MPMARRRAGAKWTSLPTRRGDAPTSVPNMNADFLNSIGAQVMSEVAEEQRRIANRPKNKKKRFKKK
jgi:hypothetical protein